MKNLLLLLFAILIVGCSNKNQISSPPPPTEVGSTILKIDRSNVPVGVTSVTATLTRQGYTTISSTLNLVSDTSASIALSSIPVGTWRLKVDAKNAVGTLLFTGEVDVTIVANTIAQVSLALQSTGNNVGGIIITVKWGTGTITNWVDYLYNPIFSKGSSPFEYSGIGHPKILAHNNIFQMWYTAYSVNGYVYGMYATSIDGISWSRHPQQPALSPGNEGSWDDRAVSPASIIKVDSAYLMYYWGVSSVSSRGQVGLATSIDGINWTKRANPVFSGSSGWEWSVGCGDVIRINNIFYMFYHGLTSTSNYSAAIGLATSLDGINWSRSSANPILSKTQNWEGNGVFYPTVVHENNQFKLVYQNAVTSTVNSGFGYAYSSDGLIWTKDAANPIFTNLMTSNNWGIGDVSYPNFRKINNEYRVYYMGTNQTNSIRSIGFFKKR